MPNRTVATMLGALTGVVTMIAMLRLISGAFRAGISSYALSFCLVALLPWIAYVAWRARRGRLRVRHGLVVLILDGVGMIAVWWFTLGPVVALASAFAAFVIIWVNDLPARRPRGDDTFVRIEELQTEDPDA